MKNVPELRFKGLESNYEIKKISSLLERVSNSVDVNPIEFYRQIGIRSHGKGIFYKDAVSGESLGNKRVFWVEPNVFILNIVFAWERAVAKTTDAEIGMIASHRFPMYKPKSGVLDLDYITLFFKTNRGKYLLELASPGGAGRNKTLGQKEFENLELAIPTIFEQKKIAAFFSLIDKKIELQTEKVEELKNYKKGLLQKIFSQELRFKDENGNEYPEWEEYKVKDLFDVTRGVVIAKSEISDTSNDIFKYAVYSSQTSNNGILGYDQTFDFDGNYLTWTTDGANAGRVFCRSGRFRCTNVCGVLVEKNNTIGYANKLVAEILNKETPKHVSYVGNPKLMNGVMAEIKLNIPSLEEQTKFDKLINQLDIKIESEQTKLNLLDDYKKGLLQQMFI